MKNETMQVYAQIDCILSHMPEEYVKKIPIKLRNKFKNEKDPEYKFEFLETKTLKEHKLSKKALALLAMLKYNYWCENQEEKDKLTVKFKENEEKYQAELREKYNPNDIFKKKKMQEKENIQLEETSISVIQEQKWYKKIFNIIKGIFRRK